MLSYLIVRYLPLPHSQLLARYSLCIAAGLWATACVVSKGEYDKAVAASEHERRAHQETRQELEEFQRKLGLAERSLARKTQLLAAKEAAAEQLEQRVARGELQADILDVEARDRGDMVEQLRNELTRVGNHLHVYAEEKTELTAALAAAEERIARLARLEQEMEIRATVVRELTLALAEPLNSGSIILSVRQGRPVVEIPASYLYDKNLKELSTSARSMLEVLGKTLAPIQSARVEVAERGGARTAEDQMSRLQLIVERLAASGLDFERVVYALSAFDGEAAASGAAAQTSAQPDANQKQDDTAVPTRVDVSVEIVQAP